MPSGITAPIYDGVDITFAQFAMRAARGLSIMGRFRDEPLDAEVPDVVEPSSYRRQALADAEEALAKLQIMTPQEIQDARDAYYAHLLSQHDEAVHETTAMRQRYEAMLAQVRAWVPPTEEHDYLKTYMIEQLEESLRFDCSYTERDAPKTDKTTAEEWYAIQLAHAHHEVEHYTAELEREVENAAKITAWVQALKASLAST